MVINFTEMSGSAHEHLGAVVCSVRRMEKATNRPLQRPDAIFTSDLQFALASPISHFEGPRPRPRLDEPVDAGVQCPFARQNDEKPTRSGGLFLFGSRFAI